MVDLFELSAYTDKLLNVKSYQDYCPNGLQVEGRRQVKKIVAGVTACMALIKLAQQASADVLLVHHGYFWKGESPVLTGMKAQRIRALLKSKMSLMAYHLPLDAHVQLGNNAQLAARLDLQIDGVLDTDQTQPIAMLGHLENEIDATAFKQVIAERLQREPQWIAGGKKNIKTVGWCTGAAQDYIQYAVDKGLDAFISGEISERTTHIAREEGIHYFAAGHHATERYGVQALGQHLADQFSLDYEFIEVENPV